MKTIRILSLALVVSAALLLNSCKKDTTTNNDSQTAEQHSLAENTFNDVHNIADEAASTGQLSSYKTDGEQGLTSNATVTIDSVTAPGFRKVTVDFGSSNIVCADGRTRRGKIIIRHAGKYFDAGTVIAISFDNYFVNDNQVLGTKTITNNGTNAQGHPTFSVEVDGSLVLGSGTGTITWKSSRTREYLEGYLTPGNRFDDKVQVTGSASGTTASGNAFTVTITSPLLRDFTCPLGDGRWHFVSGTLVMTRTGKSDVTIDFGNGACDKLATATVNGKVFNITLR